MNTVRVVSLIKDSVIAGVLSEEEEDPISFVVEVGAPLVEAHVPTLDAAAVGACASTVATLADASSSAARFAALEVGARLLCAQADALRDVPPSLLRRLLSWEATWWDERGDDATRLRASWAALVRVVCGRVDALPPACVIEIESAAATIAEKALEPRLESSVLEALELYAVVVACHAPAAARKALERVEPRLVPLLDHGTVSVRRGAVAALAALWHRTSSNRACLATERLCARLAAALDEAAAEASSESLSVVRAASTLSRRLDGTVDAAVAALGAAAWCADAALPVAPVLSSIRALAETRADEPLLALAAPAVRRAQTLLLQATLRVLGPHLARRHASFLARAALAPALCDARTVATVGLAARTLGPGVGLEAAVKPLVALVTALVIPAECEPHDDDDDDDDAEPSRKRKRRRPEKGPAKLRRNTKDGRGSADLTKAALEALTTLVYACSLANDARDLVDSLAADLFALADSPDDCFVFWRDDAVRAAGLRFAKAALATPRATGDRPPLVAAAKRATTLLDTSDAVDAVILDLRCVVDTLVRPRAPPFRQPIPHREPPDSTNHLSSPPVVASDTSDRHAEHRRQEQQQQQSRRDESEIAGDERQLRSEWPADDDRMAIDAPSDDREATNLGRSDDDFTSPGTQRGENATERNSAEENNKSLGPAPARPSEDIIVEPPVGGAPTQDTPAVEVFSADLVAPAPAAKRPPLDDENIPPEADLNAAASAAPPLEGDDDNDDNVPVAATLAHAAPPPVDDHVVDDDDDDDDDEFPEIVTGDIS